MKALDTLPKALPDSFSLRPEDPITKHFKYGDLLCRGFEKDPCRAVPPFKAWLNLEILFRDLAEPFTQYLYGYMIRKSPVVAFSYLCPKCLELRGRDQYDSHAKGRAVDLLYTGQKRLDSRLLEAIAICWMAETGILCKVWPNGSCLHLELDRESGFTIFP